MRITRKVRSLAPYAHGEQPRQMNVIKLNTNEAAYPPSAKLMALLGKFDPELLRRYPEAEFHGLRAQLARLYRTTPDRIFVGNGSDEILSLMTDAFVEDDETVATLDPSYSLYKTLAAIRGVKWCSLALGTRHQALGTKTALAIVANPNNPTGTLIPPKKIAAFAKGFKGVVAVDEAYAEYASANCIKLATAKANRNLIVMRTFSKAYSLAGLRVGYCLGPKDLIAALYKIKDSYNVDAVAQFLACAALRDQKGLKALVAKVKKTRAGFTAELAKRGWEVLPSEANFVFAKPPEGEGKRKKEKGKSLAVEIFKTLRERGIYVRHFDDPRIADWLRISIGTDAQMKRVLDEMDDILKRKGK